MENIATGIAQAMEALSSKTAGVLQPPHGGRITLEEAGVEIPVRPDVKPPRIPARFKDAGFKNFRVENEAQATGKAMTTAFVGAIANGESPMLALIGPPGVGKSHLLYAAARVLYHKGFEVYTNPWYTLADELRWGRGGPNPWEPRDVLAELYRQKIVLIDEVRPTANTAFDDTALAKFACHAYDNNVSVMITTNVSPLDLIMGPAAADRFTKVLMNMESQR